MLHAKYPRAVSISSLQNEQKMACTLREEGLLIELAGGYF